MRALSSVSLFLASSVLAGGLVGQSFVGDIGRIDVPVGGEQNLVLTAGSSFGSRSYAVFGSVTGTAPGTLIGNIVVPLNYDPWTGVTIVAANSSSLVGFRGTLDASGNARARIVVPGNTPSVAIGLRFHHAYLVYGPQSYDFASNPVELAIGGPRPFDAAAFFARITVVDGNVNYYSPNSQIGANDFGRDANNRSVKQATGINFGSISLKSELSLTTQVGYITNGRFQGARLIRRAADFDAALQNGDYGILGYAQHHYPLQGSIQPIQRWYNSGLRIVQLQYGASDPNQGPLEKLGGGKGQVGGLTPLGDAVVRELIRLNMVIDLSHVNPQTTLETCAIAKAHGVPVTANHTCMQALANYARNITDAEIRAIRDTGGVVGVMCYAPYLLRPGTGTVDDYVDHVHYLIQVAGIDHVGVATDGWLDGTMPNNVVSDGLLDGPTRYLEVAKRLHVLGYTESQMEKLFGGNLLRVYKAILK